MQIMFLHPSTPSEGINDAIVVFFVCLFYRLAYRNAGQNEPYSHNFSQTLLNFVPVENWKQNKLEFMKCAFFC